MIFFSRAFSCICFAKESVIDWNSHFEKKSVPNICKPIWKCHRRRTFQIKLNVLMFITLIKMNIITVTFNKIFESFCNSKGAALWNVIKMITILVLFHVNYVDWIVSVWCLPIPASSVFTMIPDEFLKKNLSIQINF